MNKNIFQSLKVVTLALVLSVGISYVSAWTAPTVTPPNGNVSAPINVGSTAQTKSGDLTVNKITAPTSCIGADCRTAWPTGGDNLGNHTATQALNMGTNIIVAGGANSSYGAMTIQGSKNTYSGINFKNAAGSNSGTLMMHPNYSGFFNAVDNDWRYYVDNGGNSWQPGYVNTSDVYIRASGKWASQLGGAVSPLGYTTVTSSWPGWGVGNVQCPSGYFMSGITGDQGQNDYDTIYCTRLY